jgi:hypothetical protein
MTVRRLGLPLREGVPAFEAWATAMGPCELDDQARLALAEVLASRLRAFIEERAWRTPTGIGPVEVEVVERVEPAEVSEQADRGDLQETLARLSEEGYCCYRVKGSVAVL